MKYLKYLLFILTFIPFTTSAASMDFYPTLNSSICYGSATGENFATIRGHADLTGSNPVNAYSSTTDPIDPGCGGLSVGWVMNNSATHPFTIFSRMYFFFDISSLPASSTITGATFSLWNVNQYDPFGSGQGLVLTTSTPVSTTSVQSADYAIAHYGGLAFSSSSSFASGTYNNFVLNSAGVSYVTTTRLNTFGVLTKYDFNNSEPTYQQNAAELYSFSGVNHAGTTQDPKLTITYSTPGGISRKILGVGISR